MVLLLVFFGITHVAAYSSYMDEGLALMTQMGLSSL
jgi:hypothetical protein